LADIIMFFFYFSVNNCNGGQLVA